VKVITKPDGAVFSGRTPAEIVRKMANASYAHAGGDVAEYMQDVRRRVRVWKGVELFFRTEEEFLRALESVGLVEVLAE